jgi:hypothetical protein
MRFTHWHSILAWLHARLHVQIRHRTSVASYQSNGLELIGSIAWGESQPQRRIRQYVEMVGFTKMPAAFIFSSSDSGRNIFLWTNANESA